jgi:hypothetical protein
LTINSFERKSSPPPPEAIVCCRKYKFMETHLLQRKASLETKIPEIQKSLDVVEFLLSKKESQDDASEEDDLKTEFELADTLWAKARIPTQNLETVNLWLGVRSSSFECTSKNLE